MAEGMGRDLIELKGCLQREFRRSTFSCGPGLEDYSVRMFSGLPLRISPSVSYCILRCSRPVGPHSRSCTLRKKASVGFRERVPCSGRARGRSRASHCVGLARAGCHVGSRLSLQHCFHAWLFTTRKRRRSFRFPFHTKREYQVAALRGTTLGGLACRRCCRLSKTRQPYCSHPLE